MINKRVPTNEMCTFFDDKAIHEKGYKKSEVLTYPRWFIFMWTYISMLRRDKSLPTSLETKILFCSMNRDKSPVGYCS